MTEIVDAALRDHLLRRDGQEDLCFALWQPSTGVRRRSALIVDVALPRLGDRSVHGNASFEASYALRAMEEAARRGAGLAFLHSHPGGRGWQKLNDVDRRAEASVANAAREITGLPLVGMTLAGDGAWSARVWERARGSDVSYADCESVRVIADRLRVTFNDELRPPPRQLRSQQRTVHAWGERIQADLTRLRVLVVGGGSVGLHIVEVLARTGIEHIAVMDFDRVEVVNLDRLHGATLLDARLRTPKVDVARRILRDSATSKRREHETFELSVCEPDGMRTLLDFDVVFACADRPWPRHVLNTIAYADLIPVIDGGIRVDQMPGGDLRNATWRSHVVTAARPCLVCIGQYDPGHVQLERDGSLDSPTYIAGLPADHALRVRQNVGAFSIAAASAYLNQFVSLTVAPSGMGDPGPLRYSLSAHLIERDPAVCRTDCPYQASVAEGDGRMDPSAGHPTAEHARSSDSPAARLTRSALGSLGALWAGLSASAARPRRKQRNEAPGS